MILEQKHSTAAHLFKISQVLYDDSKFSRIFTAFLA